MAAATTQAERQAQVLAAGYNGPLTDAAINQAYANAASPADLAASGLTGYTPQTGSVSPTVSSPAATNTTASGAQLAAGIQGLLGAAASGNKDAINEAIREFNSTFGLDQQKFQDSIRQFNENLAITQAGLTGTYQGQQTQQAQLQAYNEAVGAAGLTGYYVAPGTSGAAGGALAPGNLSWNQVSQQLQPLAGAAYNDAAAKAAYQQALGLNPAAFNGGQAAPLSQAQLNAIAAAGGAPAGAVQAQPGVMTTAYQNQLYTQQMGAINAAAALQANPFRQAQVIGQAGRVLQGLPTAGFGAPNTVAGVGTAGGNTQGGMGYLQQLIDDIKDPTANQTTAQSWLDNTPTPNKLDSVSFMNSSPTTQNLILQAQQEKYGLDPTDSLAQIKNTLPQFSAPNTVGTVRRG
jgi:hypothetical protein